MNEEGHSPQFWLLSASTGANTRRNYSSNFFYSTLFLLIMSIPVLLILHYAFSSFQSSASQILKPNSVRKSWDSINVLLVLFAVVCGIFAKWNEDESNTSKNLENPVEEVSDGIQLQQASSPRTPTSSYELRWYDLSHEKQMHTTTASGGSRLRRNSSSYPDLRQQSDMETTSKHGLRYYDDFEISRFNRSLEMQSRKSHGITRINEDPDAKVIHVDTHQSQPNSSHKPETLQNNPPSHPPLPPITNQKKMRLHQSVPKRERQRMKNAPPPRAAAQMQPQKEDRNGLTSQTKPQQRKVHRNVPRKEYTNTRSTYESSSNLTPSSPLHVNIPTKDKYPEPKTSSTAQKQEKQPSNETEATEISSPSQPPTSIQPEQNQKPTKKEKKKNSAKKEITMVWASIYKRKKKHNQPQQLGRSDSDNYNGISQLFTESESQHISPPRLFPPPPPPPPPHSVFHALFKKSTLYKTKKIHSTPPPSGGKPPLPRRQIINTKPEYVTNKNGSESPMFEIPRPPPLPPFRVLEAKFVVQGGYARIMSNESSRNGSPEHLGFDETLVEEDVKGETASYCASPDVNAKAETFIARLRGEWRLEKLNES